VPEVNAAPAVVVVDLLAPTLPGVCPVRNLARHDTGEYLIELGFADEERIVFMRDFSVLLMEVQGNPVAQFHDDEGAERYGRIEAENLREKARCLPLVPAPGAGV